MSVSVSSSSSVSLDVGDEGDDEEEDSVDEEDDEQQQQQQQPPGGLTSDCVLFGDLPVDVGAGGVGVAWKSPKTMEAV